MANIAQAEREALEDLRCHRCRYLLRGLTLNRLCPECGETVVDAFLATGSCRKTTVIGLACGIVLLVLFVIILLNRPRTFIHIGKSKSGVAQAEVAILAQQLGLWCLNNGITMPTRGTTLDVLIQGNNPNLRPNDLIDPWGRAYLLSIPGKNGRDFSVHTLARDGISGGTGEDADISH